MAKTRKSEAEKHSFGTSYRLRTDGFKQETSDLTSARKAFQKLKNAKLREQEAFTIKLEEKTENGWVVLEEVTIKETYFGE